MRFATAPRRSSNRSQANRWPGGASLATGVACLSFALLFSACTGRPAEQEVVVYTALDREFSEAIFREFTAETGIEVRAKYDSEANKSVGLANLLVNERQRPRCDLFWNNEIVNTLRLDQADLLMPSSPQNQVHYPAEFRSPTGDWFGFAARARILLVNTDRLQRMQRDDSSITEPDSIHDLVKPQWKDKVGIAKPLFGTTATHAACLFAALGEQEASDYFRALRENVMVFPGNRQVAQAVGSGQLVCGLTDTDDAMIEIRSGRPVRIVYPDQAPGELGTLYIPNTLSVIRGAPNPKQAQRLLDYLLDARTERRLAEGESAQVPLNSLVDPSGLPIETPATVRPMDVDFRLARENWDAMAKFMRHEFLDD